ncbi:MAG: TPM domain-containing protein [Bacteroidia bacterium]
MKTKLNHQEEEKIVAAIGQAEKLTSGEIRVHIESVCKGDPLDRGANVFFDLKMNETRDRNGVLIYIALKDRKLAILGDSGINKVVPDGFWDQTSKLMVDHFKREEFARGIEQAVLMAGEHLQKYFPLKDDDTNELSNEISKGD